MRISSDLTSQNGDTYRVILDAVGLPIYMHLIARTEHLSFIDTIKEYVMTNYGKPSIDDH